MTRVAAVDLGTNSTRLLVADVVDGAVEGIVRQTVVTRLGEGVDSRRRLLPTAIARVRNALSDFRRELEALGAERVLAVGTSAVRDAENGEAFLGEIEWSYGFATRLLTGDEEAELTRRGVSVGGVAADTLVVDVGGGSTELIAGSYHQSFDIGSVRLTERFLRDDPPATEELDDAAEYVRATLPTLRVDAAVGVAGTVAQLAELAQTERLTLGDVEDWLDRLASVGLTERRTIERLDPARAPVIVGGTLIVREVLRAYGLDTLRFSVRDLLDGIALAAAALPVTTPGDAPPGAFTCC